MNQTHILTPEQEKFLKKWSWGALVMPTIYFLISGLMKEALFTFIPFLNIYIWIKGIVSGRRMSWERGEWKSFEVFQKRQKVTDWIGVVFLALVLAASIIPIFLALFLTSPAVTSADMFFREVAAGRVEEAYRSASPGFREVAPLEDFESFVEENAFMKRYADYSFASRSFSGDTATLTGKIITENGEKYPVEVWLLRVDGVWRVDGFEL
jgi:hypothetical protein